MRQVQLKGCLSHGRAGSHQYEIRGLHTLLPHSIEAEQSVIGSMIMDREAIVVASELVSGEDSQFPR